jgi:mono/diheme cytochrome c family protein
MKWRFGKAALWLVVAGTMVFSATPIAAQRRRPNRPPPVDLPRGPVRQVIIRNCTACHGIDDYAFFALDRAGWQSLLQTKHKAGGAVLSDEDRNTLLDYLVAKFGPDSKPFKPPQGQARPGAAVNDEVVATASADIATRRILETACNTCHSLEQVYAARYTEDKWRELVSGMRSKGAKVSDGDIDALVEYFARTQGANPN